MNYYERFLSPAERHVATNELASLKEGALPILKALFDGTATNKFGISYNEIGAVGCGYVTVGLLGATAKPLEAFVRYGIEQDNSYAIEAAGYIPDLDEQTVFALANALVRNPSSEAAASLVRNGQSSCMKTLKIVNTNPAAIQCLKNTESNWAKHKSCTRTPVSLSMLQRRKCDKF